MPEVPQVNERSKKTEILDAYHAALKKLKEKKQILPKEEREKKEEKAVCEQAAKQSHDEIVNRLEEIRSEVDHFLDALEGKLTESHQQFENLQQAIQIAEKDLEEMHAISAEGDTLAALVGAHREMTQSFENEMQLKKSNWEVEKQTYEKNIKEQQNHLTLERKREQEDYQYQLQKKRKIEADAYEQQKIKQEKELLEMRERTSRDLAQRQAVIEEKEQELEELSKQVTTFPEKLEAAIDKTRLETEERVKKELQFKMELTEKEMEGDKNLFKQKIEALETKIQEQDQQVVLFRKNAQDAGLQAQKIAEKAIEGATRRLHDNHFQTGTTSSQS